MEKIKCFCGHTFEFDWDKVSVQKAPRVMYIRCPKCYMELIIANPKYSDKEIDYNHEFYRMVTNLWEDGKCSYVDLKQV